MTTWNLKGTQKHVLICNGSSCMRKEGEEITLAIREEIATLQLDHEIHTSRTRCNGRCKDACVVIVYPEGKWYSATSTEVGRDIIKNHVDPSIHLHDALIYDFVDDELNAVNESSRIEGIMKKEKTNV
ncbi:(2Fe-2S) ferredoxin domain-containing protein [Halalkalibacter krulwichiae]|uniref:(2Fe-2S) ferredoxin domain-containing protein n=1 Tax=Halalkalibacter krulwichiae TaxID=199441 RepID=UPI0008255807|nr:(2Fe-2S) ferredoxin domain-containing protein [Halalkalibacter krulwichiae]